mmetsp:Transcript_80694/g.251620  ORF Transcript_80694/g.251620 Transcript_80694/m.251620 type:complete len:522 (-) Transcript_80694:76-1641(-)
MASEAEGFTVGERVFVHGLVSPRGALFNLLPAQVIVALCDDGVRVGVRLLHRRPASRNDAERLRNEPKRVELSVRPTNLLRAPNPVDRRRVLLAQVVATRPELRAVCRFLDERLPAGPGGSAASSGDPTSYTDDTSPLLFRIASFVASTQALPHQFSGYMGRLWFEHWRWDEQARVEPVNCWSLADSPSGESGGSLTPRMDCAATTLDPDRPGLALFAGGCGDHPQRCRTPFGFYKSAVLYDSLLSEWHPLPDMTTRRHGPGAACIGPKVYVLGGQYAHDSDDEEGGPRVNAGRQAGPRFCDVYDLDKREWSLQPPSALRGVLQEEHMLQVVERAAFFSVGAVSGRVVACLHDRRQPQEGLVTLAFNPDREEDGWRKVALLPAEGGRPIHVGTSSCAATYNDQLVVASGRPSIYARSCAAFRFEQRGTSEEGWHYGRWRQLPDLNFARVGGALVAVSGKLYITGGVNEESGSFRDDVECLDEDSQPPCWKPVPWFSMPRALHAHDVMALPTLAAMVRLHPD